jgi:hypothetical protein
VHNQNSHRSVESLSIAVSDSTDLTNVGFHDVHYHSSEEDVIYGTDWTFAHAGGNATWTAVDEGSHTNAIRWATSYTFRFDANAAPVDGTVSMGYWRDGPTDSLDVTGSVPGSDAGCTGDVNDDGVVDVEDVLVVIAGFGTDYMVEDLLIVLANYGSDC